MNLIQTQSCDDINLFKQLNSFESAQDISSIETRDEKKYQFVKHKSETHFAQATTDDEYNEVDILKSQIDCLENAYHSLITKQKEQ